MNMRGRRYGSQRQIRKAMHVYGGEASGIASVSLD